MTCSSCSQGQLGPSVPSQQESSRTLAPQLSPAMCPGAMPVLGHCSALGGFFPALPYFWGCQQDLT